MNSAQVSNIAQFSWKRCLHSTVGPERLGIMAFQIDLKIKLFFCYLKRQTKGLVGRSGGWEDGVEGLEKGSAVGLALLTLDGPSLVPSHVGGWLQHVVAVPSGDGDEGDRSRIVADFLDEARHLLLDLLEPGT